MDRFNITTEDPETSVVINEMSGLNLNESQVGLNQFEEKQEDVSSDEDLDVNKAKQKVIKLKKRAKKVKNAENTLKTKSPIDDSGHESNESKVKMLYFYCLFTLIHQILAFCVFLTILLCRLSLSQTPPWL